MGSGSCLWGRQGDFGGGRLRNRVVIRNLVRAAWGQAGPLDAGPDLPLGPRAWASERRRVPALEGALGEPRAGGAQPGGLRLSWCRAVVWVAVGCTQEEASPLSRWKPTPGIGWTPPSARLGPRPPLCALPSLVGVESSHAGARAPRHGSSPALGDNRANNELVGGPPRTCLLCPWPCLLCPWPMVAKA